MPPLSAKLTLSVERSLIEDAKRIAEHRKTSVSAMFAAFLRSVAQADNKAAFVVGPVTRRAAGLVKLPAGRSDRALMEDALSTRYGTAK